MREPYRYEREVEDFLRWSPYVRHAIGKREARLSPDEMVELQKLLTVYRAQAGGAPRARAEAVARTPGRRSRHDERAARRSLAPLEHYDDLQAEELVSLIGSLESDDLVALLDYERARLNRGPVVSEIETVLDRRRTGPSN